MESITHNKYSETSVQRWGVAVEDFVLADGMAYLKTIFPEIKFNERYSRIVPGCPVDGYIAMKGADSSLIGHMDFKATSYPVGQFKRDGCPDGTLLLGLPCHEALSKDSQATLFQYYHETGEVIVYLYNLCPVFSLEDPIVSTPDKPVVRIGANRIALLYRRPMTLPEYYQDISNF